MKLTNTTLCVGMISAAILGAAASMAVILTPAGAVADQPQTFRWEGVQRGAVVVALVLDNDKCRVFRVRDTDGGRNREFYLAQGVYSSSTVCSLSGVK